MSQQERIDSARTNIGCVNKRFQPLRSLCERCNSCLVADVVGVIRSHSVCRRGLFIKVSGIGHYFANSFPFVRLHIFEFAQWFIARREVLIDKFGLFSSEVFAKSIVLWLIDFEDWSLKVSKICFFDVCELGVEFGRLLLLLDEESWACRFGGAGLTPAEHKSNIICRPSIGII